jgi:glutamate-1-semialdehyde 2,1-aminomutase
MPIGVFGGRTDIMELCAAVEGRAVVQHSSSLAAHPVVMAACLATLRACDEEVIATLADLGEHARAGMRRVLEETGIAGQVTGIQHLFGLHLVDAPVRSYADVRHQPPGAGAAISGALLRHGVLMSGNRGCVNAATTRADIDEFLAALHVALREVAVEDANAAGAPR